MTDGLRTAAADLGALRINRDPNRPRRGWVAPIAVVSVVALIVAGWMAMRWRNSARLPVVEAGLVRLVSATRESALLSASGYLLPDRRANVSSKAFGTLDWIGIDVGSRVKEGEVIARLANADVAARVEEATAAVRDAEREYERWKKAVDDGVEPRERLDKLDTQLALARARLKTVEAELDFTLIRAPFGGIVSRKSAEVGETLGPAGGWGSGSSGGALCQIFDPDSLEMVADVSETNIAKVVLGQEVEIAVDAIPERKYRGRVRLVVPTADRAKGIVQVKIALEDRDEALLPEMASRATFLRAGGAAVGTKRVVAPSAAVKDRGGRRVVLVIEGGRVRQIGVDTGLEGEDGIEILAGLRGGERVVTGGDRVEDGAEVQVKEEMR